MTNVFNETRVIGRLIDLGDGTFRADYIDVEGDLQEDLCPDYFSALDRVIDHAVARHRVLN
ncbi:MAG: hypothetical protein ACWGQW_25730 [bacterium]